MGVARKKSEVYDFTGGGGGGVILILITAVLYSAPSRKSI